MERTDISWLVGARVRTKRLTEATFPWGALIRLSERSSGGVDGVDPVVLRAAGSLLVLDLDDVFAGLSQHR